MAVVYIVQWLQGVGDFFSSLQSQKLHCILFLKLFWPIVRRNCSSDQEKAEDREFEKLLRSLEKFIQTVEGQNNFW